MNDPNGLFYYNDEYHLYYQHNPFENKFGHLSWGHAVSKDLVNWEHLPVALKEENNIMIFSGCIVVDYNNTSGFGKSDLPPVIAIYTGFLKGDGSQFQCLAYSNDNGRQWTKYKYNPVLDINSNDFRDPKVFRYEPDNSWIMIVASAMENKLMFFSSPNLIEWKHISDFSYPEFKKIKWECPDIFSLPVDNDTSKLKWVLFVSKLSDNIATDTCSAYFVGEFNGKEFIVDERFHSLLKSKKEASLDSGRDFYAAATWNNISMETGKTICIAWMNNWKYAERLPTSGWNGAMTIPRRLYLQSTETAFHIIQRPVEELKKLRGQLYSVSDTNINGINSYLAAIPIIDIKHEFILEISYNAGNVAGVELFNKSHVELKIEYDDRIKNISIDRNTGNKTVPADEFYKLQEAWLNAGGKLKLHVFLDSSSVEVFVNNGEAVMSSLFFPSCEEHFIRITGNSIGTNITLFNMWELKSIWRREKIEDSINSLEMDRI